MQVLRIADQRWFAKLSDCSLANDPLQEPAKQAGFFMAGLVMHLGTMARDRQVA